MIDDIARKIVDDIYLDEVIEAIRKTRKDRLFSEINVIVGDEEKANEILKKALDRAGVKYTVCEKTGFVITYLNVERYTILYSTMDIKEKMGDEDENYDDSAYFCPHCGRHIEEIFNDDEAIEIIRGERDEYGNPK
jgi:Zn finger protein HypA/HybF involved in hydrogenase expression